MKVAVGSDHAGFTLKQFLKENLPDISWIDLGPTSADRTDYPDFAEKVAQKVLSKECAFGVLICGSGIGMSIAANKIAGIRAAHVESEITAKLSRAHNDANILCIGSRITGPEYAKEIIETWLNTSFEGGRHQDRIKKISKLEQA